MRVKLTIIFSVYLAICSLLRDLSGEFKGLSSLESLLSDKFAQLWLIFCCTGHLLRTPLPGTSRPWSMTSWGTTGLCPVHLESYPSHIIFTYLIGQLYLRRSKSRFGRKLVNAWRTGTSRWGKWPPKGPLWGLSKSSRRRAWVFILWTCCWKYLLNPFMNIPQSEEWDWAPFDLCGDETKIMFQRISFSRCPQHHTIQTTPCLMSLWR